MILLGFMLLGLLFLGGVILLLAIPALVLTLILAVASLLFPPLFGVTLVLLSVAASAFAIGIFLVLLGSLSLLSPAVLNFLGIVVQLVRTAFRLLPSVNMIAGHLRLGAAAMDFARDALSKDNAPSLDDVGQAIIDAGAVVPEIHTLNPSFTRLFQSDITDPTTGLIPWLDIGILEKPDVEVATGLQHATVPVGQTIEDIGNAVKTTAEGVSEKLGDTATAMRGIAQILEDSSQN